MMDRIYEENLNEWNEFLADQNGEYDIEIDCQTLKRIVTELKERREADSKPLDIKGQLRLARDKCPDVWDTLNSTAKALNYALEALDGEKNE